MSKEIMSVESNTNVRFPFVGTEIKIPASMKVEIHFESVDLIRKWIEEKLNMLSAVALSSTEQDKQDGQDTTAVQASTWTEFFLKKARDHLL